MKSPVLLSALFALSLAAMSAANVSSSPASIVLGGGCFWCVEASFRLQPGVRQVTCGYAGGTTPHPTYEEVCSHTTGHAEVVRVDYDPSQISLERLLDFFWQIHDPTQVGGQGYDAGPQYRSIILYANEEQRIAAERSRAAAQKDFLKPIVTEIVPLRQFWPAEEYHQDYFRKNPNAAYCRAVIAPKIEKLKHGAPGAK